MSTPAGSHNEDNDSDLDLDLNELDPQSTPRPPSTRRQASGSRISYDFGRRIPLRNLRFGGRRRPRDEDADDLEALVGDDADDARKRESATSLGYGGDDAPLLSNGNGSIRRTRSPYQYAEPKGKRKWKLWGCVPFLSTRSVSLALSSPIEASDEAEEDDPTAMRTVSVGQIQAIRFPPNAISNAKYTPFSFLPRTLFNEFKFFFNLYFLLVALSQVIPALRIGYLSTYIAPLAFVISITLGKEAYDDISRRKRDREANSEPYKVLIFDEGVGGLPNGTSKGKRKIKQLSERKKGKRRKIEDGTERLTATEEEEQNVESLETPSSRVREIVRPAKDLRVGDVVVLGKNQRVPADLIVLKSFSAEHNMPEQAAMPPVLDETNESLVDMGSNATEANAKLQREAIEGQDLENDTTTLDPSGGGEAFVRTDQLDGETDWKLRLASPLAQNLSPSEYVRLRLTAGKPDRRVNDFVGTLELLPKTSKSYDPHIDRAQSSDEFAGPAQDNGSKSLPLTIDNTAWANTVLASATTVHAVVTYTGAQTRAALSTSPSRSKTGLLEHEINSLTKILCVLTAALSFILVALEGFNTEGHREWYIAVMRFLILFSTIVPISLRVNLDMGKSIYAWFIHRDDGIPGTVVRTSTIPEDLGRIEYLLSDKTGTLTRNEMELRKVHVGTVSYGGEAMEEVAGYIKQAFAAENMGGFDLFTPSSGGAGFSGPNTTRTRREIGVRVRDLVLALALCHNVTPTTEEDDDGKPVTAYQASSPDEIAIVRWTEDVGLRLVHRDRRSISLQSSRNGRVVVRVEILNIFPFTSDSKRMGIIVRFSRSSSALRDEEGEIVFFQKGADTVMSSIVAANDWLDEETGNMAREGLRTMPSPPPTPRLRFLCLAATPPW
jgi:phospholipid-translocating ATPase